VTRPRPVFPDTFPFITRRCTQRQFLLRPDEETNNAFIYCMAIAAERYQIDVILPQMMSNHYHAEVYDRHGHHTEFRQYFHGLLSKCQNALRGRWENLWATEEPCVIEVVGRETRTTART
jgi:putative transposase